MKLGLKSTLGLAGYSRSWPRSPWAGAHAPLPRGEAERRHRAPARSRAGQPRLRAQRGDAPVPGRGLRGAGCTSGSRTSPCSPRWSRPWRWWIATAGWSRATVRSWDAGSPRRPQLFGEPARSRLGVERAGRSFLQGGDYMVARASVEKVPRWSATSGSCSTASGSPRSTGRAVPDCWAWSLLGPRRAWVRSAHSCRSSSRAGPPRSRRFSMGRPRARAGGSPRPTSSRACSRSASRVKGDLDEARRESERRGPAGRGPRRKSSRWGWSSLRPGPAGGLRERPALELMGCADEAAFRAPWDGLQSALRAALDGAAHGPGDGGRSLRARGPRRGAPVQAEIHRARRDPPTTTSSC